VTVARESSDDTEWLCMSRYKLWSSPVVGVAQALWQPHAAGQWVGESLGSIIIVAAGFINQPLAIRAIWLCESEAKRRRGSADL